MYRDHNCGELTIKNVGETDSYNSNMTWKVQEPTIESYVSNEKILFYSYAYMYHAKHHKLLKQQE